MSDHWNSIANLLGTPSLNPMSKKPDAANKTPKPMPQVESAPKLSEILETEAELVEPAKPKVEPSRLRSSWDAVAQFFGVATPEPVIEASLAINETPPIEANSSVKANVPFNKKLKPSMWGAPEVESTGADLNVSDMGLANTLPPDDRGNLEGFGRGARDRRPRNESTSNKLPSREVEVTEIQRDFDSEIEQSESRGRRQAPSTRDNQSEHVDLDRRSTRRAPRRGRGTDETPPANDDFGVELGSETDTADSDTGEFSNSEQTGERGSGRGRGNRDSHRGVSTSREVQNSSDPASTDRGSNNRGSTARGATGRSPSGRSSSERGSSERSSSERGSSERSSSERGSSERGSSERGSSERGSSERGSSERGSSERGSSERGSSERTNVDRPAPSDKSDRPERESHRGDRGDKSPRPERPVRQERSRSPRDESPPRESKRESTARESSGRSQVDRDSVSREDRRPSRPSRPTGFGAGLHDDEFDVNDESLDEREDFVMIEDDDIDLDDDETAIEKGDVVVEDRDAKPKRRRGRGRGKRGERSPSDMSDRGELGSDRVELDEETVTRHTKIPSWQDAIGTLVATNMENHQRTPNHSRGPRGRGPRRDR